MASMKELIKEKRKINSELRGLLRPMQEDDRERIWELIGEYADNEIEMEEHCNQ